MLRSDIAQYENLTKFGLTHTHSSDESDSIVQLGISKNMSKHKNSNINVKDQDIKLKEELHRALLGKYHEVLLNCCGCVPSVRYYISLYKLSV